MPTQYSCQAKTTVDPKRVVVKDRAEKSYIVVHVCCVDDQSAQQECLLRTAADNFALPAHNSRKMQGFTLLEGSGNKASF